MNWYCNTCEKTVKLGKKYTHLNTPSHKRFSEGLLTKYVIQNPEFFGVDVIIYNYFDKHSKKYGFNIVKYDLKLVFEDFTPHINSKLELNL